MKNLNLENAPEFVIKNISYSKKDWYNNTPEALVTVVMPIGVFNHYKKRKDLGSLYGCAISNEVYRIDPSIVAYNPTVNDSKKASGGLKTITLRYTWNEPKKAELRVVK